MHTPVLLQSAVVIIILLSLYACCGQRHLHPDFIITYDDINERIKGLPEEIQTAILSKPQYFCELMGDILDNPQELVLLVDKTHPLLKTYEPDDLVLLADYPVRITRPKLEVRKIIIENLLAMVEAAEKEGISLPIASAYRSFEYQEKLHRYWIHELGKEQAIKESAPAGHSQHQLGTTIDFYPINDSFADTQASSWLAGHAHLFGFSLSYPDGFDELTGYKYEPWHYRYIGKTACYLTNEFFSGIQQYFLQFYHDHAAFFSEKRKKSK
jgi:D-alanyl-D-alanine carboxypeptidase